MFPRVIPLVQPGCLCLTHPFATHHQSDAFDLHVLGTPPAFILSQDQTLHDSVFTIKVVFLWLFFVFWLVFLFFSIFLSFDRNCLTCSVQFSMVSAVPDWTACLYYHVLSPLTSLFYYFFYFFKKIIKTKTRDLSLVCWAIASFYSALAFCLFDTITNGIHNNVNNTISIAL